MRLGRRSLALAPVLLAVGAVVALGVLVAVTIFGGSPGAVHRRATGHRVHGAGLHRLSSPVSPSGTAPAPVTPVQQRIDAQLAKAESPEVIAELEATTVPRPAVSKAFPPVPAADRSDGTRWCAAFVYELMDVGYARRSRSALLAWAEEEEAPNRMPGVPPAVADKALVASLSGVGSTSGSPVRSPAGWKSAAVAHETVSVSGLTVTTDRSWSELLGAGWVPADPLATVEDVTGTVTERAAHGRTRTARFSLTVMLGSARFHPGYGAVAVGGWHLAPAAG